MTPGTVFDRRVFVQAPANARGPASARYDLVRAGRPTLHVSPEIVAEVGDVLGPPKLGRKLPALTDEPVDAFLRGRIGRAETLSEVPEAYRLDRDPKDERCANLTVARAASYLVTWDRDPLDLMGDEEFGRQSPGFTILEPPARLRLLHQDSTETRPA